MTNVTLDSNCITALGHLVTVCIRSHYNHKFLGAHNFASKTFEITHFLLQICIFRSDLRVHEKVEMAPLTDQSAGKRFN